MKIMLVSLLGKVIAGGERSHVVYHEYACKIRFSLKFRSALKIRFEWSAMAHLIDHLTRHGSVAGSSLTAS